jgi:oligopeptidase A
MNPLLDADGLPAFSAIRPEHAEPAVKRVLAEARARIEQIAAAALPRCFETVVQPLEDIGDRLHRVWSPVSHLNAVMNTPAMREAYNACLPLVTGFQADLGQDERLFAAYLEIAAGADFGRLDDAQRKIVEHGVRDFRLAGADLPPAKKARFKAIQEELAALHARFDENLLDATNGFVLDIDEVSDLAGLPELALTQARDAAREAGVDGHRFTLHAPSYFPLMSHAENRALRRRMYEAFVTRASDAGPNPGAHDNGPVMTRILALDAEKARLLGFASYAEFSLATKMADSPAQVMAFLRDLAARARARATAELAELRAFAREQLGLDEIEAWDVPFVSERLRVARYDFSEEALRPYFPLPVVLDGLFRVVREIYGLRVQEAAHADAWHPDVRFFEMFDEDDALRGQFFVDLFPRAGKRGGAWMDDCISRRRTPQGVQIPVAHLVCNFMRPVAGRPALLTHDEVATLFHEFGHGLHHMLTRVDYASIGGINGVAWDAIELPSQFMENFCWDRRVLGFLARHYETGESLPAAMLDRMLAAKNFQSGLQLLRQVELSLFDMRLHAEPPPPDVAGILRVLDEVRHEVALLMPPSFNRFPHGFSHVFGGSYAAGYYSYKWAEVLSADAFDRFEENGVLDRATGEAFRRAILEQGAVYEPMDLFVRFRGRKPTIDALLRHTGIAA